MWKILVLAPLLFILSNSEVVSKRKTIPLSKQTCPCWWDLEGTQIDPNTNEPYKCACCKSGKKICNFLMLLCRACWDLWQYGLQSFQTGDTKLERFLPKNQHTQSKLLNFGLMASCQKVPKFYFQSQFSMSKTIQISLIYF